MEVLEQTGGLTEVSDVSIIRVPFLCYLSIIAEEEADAIVGVSPFKKLVVRGEVQAEWRSA